MSFLLKTYFVVLGFDLTNHWSVSPSEGPDGDAGK